jgi:hypothetical protein
MTFMGLKDYAQAEGVLVELGVASELVADLSYKNRVPETVEYYETLPCNSVKPQVDFVLVGSVTGTCQCVLTPVSRNMPQKLGFHSLLWFLSSLSRPLRLTIITNHEQGWAQL